METPFGNIPEWLTWLIGTVLAIVVPIVIYRRQKKKTRPPNLHKPAFHNAQAVALDANGKPDIFTLLSWRTRYADRHTLPGRQQRLQELLDWAEEGLGLKVAIISAPGGAGKTRLAMEAAEQLHTKGWEAGFHSREDSDDLHLPPRKMTRGWFRQRGLFLIIDYPESRGTQQVASLLRQVKDWQARMQAPARVLLLSRDNEMEQWHLHMRTSLPDIPISPLPMLKVLAESDALQLARNVHDSLQGIAPFSALDNHWPDNFRDWLARDATQHGLPLFIIAAMLQAMLAKDDTFRADDRHVLRELSEREMLRATAVSENIGLPGNALPRLLGLAVLAGGLDGAAIARLRGQEGLGGDALNEDALRATPWWDGEQNRLMLHAPDRAATAFLATALLDGAHEHDLPQWLWLALQDVAETFARELPRLLCDLLNFDQDARERLQQALQEMIGKDPEPPSRAQAFKAITTMQNHLSAPLAISIGKVMVKHASDASSKAKALKDISVNYARVGQHKKALKSAQDAAEIYGQLAKTRLWSQ